MADVFSSEKRSAVMAKIRSSGNRDTELRMCAILRSTRIRGWRRHLPLPGKPDFAFPKSRLALFIDGCFWHGCARHGTQPKSNSEYWTKKLLRNRSRDRKVTRLLRNSGWRVLRIWEHELKDPAQVAKRVERRLIAT